ncbi:hypothetical protein HDF19_08250 [Mucilaginibacter sp. E4BP6]|jgi:hypothetical protein|uniref:hypothetical protein n=1 Tax=Mucilaginibacter sp. E4BP6 TaxID=2723089 RepID=UPI0015CA253B|nr:hypothetical protein [Mucilaginibacter sp. E4BP6]NYE67602.1 hypothetical protein [Mucilaginibacter sp. E4BP6]
MKTYNKIATSKLVNRFDEELLNILREDLKAVKIAKVQFINRINNNLLPAA